MRAVVRKSRGGGEQNISNATFMKRRKCFFGDGKMASADHPIVLLSSYTNNRKWQEPQSQVHVMCWWEAEETADVKDALIQMPVSGISTDTGFEYSTHMRKICANTTTLKPVYLNWLQGRQRGVIVRGVEILQLQTTEVHHPHTQQLLIMSLIQQRLDTILVEMTWITCALHLLI